MRGFSCARNPEDDTLWPGLPLGRVRVALPNLEIISEALTEAGARIEDVVRTRVFLINADDWQDVGRAHHEFLGDVMPASTMVLIAGILDPRWVVEIEADAVVPEGR